MKGRCKRTQAMPPPQQPRAPPQPGSDYHGVESQRALWGGEQRWPPPLQPSESYPKYPLNLTEKKQVACINYNKTAIWGKSQEREHNSVLLDDFLTGLFPNPSIPDLRHSDPIPVKKQKQQKNI